MSTTIGKRYRSMLQQAISPDGTVKKKRTIPKLRWWIGGLLFLSTVINYIDRQTLSVLAPFLKLEYHWSNEDFALIVIAFRAAYAIGQSFSGRFLDRMGTRKGLTFTVIWYSIAAMLGSLASGLRSFCSVRFLLGAGESANWPGATKAVSEWFPKRERGWAVALFDSGSSIGGAVAPFLVLWSFHTFGSWRYVFLVTGTLGFLWLIAWRIIYYSPERHPWISNEERHLIMEEKTGTTEKAIDAPSISWKTLIKLPQTWGIIIGKTFTDPVWFFIADWFVIYLFSKGIRLEQGLMVFWIPFIAADLGNFFGGGVSSWLIKRGWNVLKARKAVILFGGTGMLLLSVTAFTSNPFILAGCFGFSTLAYAAFGTMILVLPSDLYPSHSVATVSGMSGTGAGLGTIVSTFLIGYVADHYSFEPILIGASFIPFLAMIVVLFLLRDPKTKNCPCI
jgi:MFS transporter, ACS family, hexuronate transporter